MSEKIYDLYAQAEALRRSDPAKFMVESKKEKECWILGRFADAYNANADRKIIAADAKEAPDFIVFDETDRHAAYIEVTEWLDAGRRRDQEYKSSPPESVRHVDDDPSLKASAVAQLQRQLEKKLLRAAKYPHGTWLVIYLNVLYSMFWMMHDQDAYKEETDVASEVVGELLSICPATISQIWILHPIRSAQTVIHRLYPDRLRMSGNWLSTQVKPLPAS